MSPIPVGTTLVDRAALAGTVAALALLLSACGSDGGGTPTASCTVSAVSVALPSAELVVGQEVVASATVSSQNCQSAPCRFAPRQVA